mmetsp:Transcript_37753/g.102915  ORF Transcript_37753/g.102915 Transcript_37753/m.102915 type:complete len:194 (+) Transcript_37753:367-948(+)
MAEPGAPLEPALFPLVLQLTNPDQREAALLELSKKREAFSDLVSALLQEIISIYPMLSPPTLTAHASNRVCNALALLQCVASHQETRGLFLSDGRLGGHQLSPANGDYPPLSPDHGDRERAIEDGRHVHCAEDPARRDGPQLHLRDGGAVLCGQYGAVQHGGGSRGAALGATAQAHCPVLPAALGQPAGSGGA